MPFTGSHPSAVLPFLRTPLPASALVFGSMAPDIPYYLPLPQWYVTHSALAVVTSDLLVGALAWALWHGLLAAPALTAAPPALRARLVGRVELGLASRLASARRVVLLVCALVLGAATHVLWDEFTHPRRWGTEHVPVLADNWGLLPGYRWLQYVTSVIGGLVLLAWFARWWRRAPEAPAEPRPRSRWVWPVLVAIGVAFGGVAAAASPSIGAAGFAGARWAGGAVLVAGILLSAGWYLARHRTSASGAPRSPR